MDGDLHIRTTTRWLGCSWGRKTQVRNKGLQFIALLFISYKSHTEHSQSCIWGGRLTHDASSLDYSHSRRLGRASQGNHRLVTLQTTNRHCKESNEWMRWMDETGHTLSRSVTLYHPWRLFPFFLLLPISPAGGVNLSEIACYKPCPSGSACPRHRSINSSSSRPGQRRSRRRRIFLCSFSSAGWLSDSKWIKVQGINNGDDTETLPVGLEMSMDSDRHINTFCKPRIHLLLVRTLHTAEKRRRTRMLTIFYAQLCVSPRVIRFRKVMDL